MTELAFIRINQALRPFASTPTDCGVCGRPPPCQWQLPYDGAPPATAMVICDECRADCNERCMEAAGLIARAPFPRPKALRDHAMAQRIAFLRSTHHMHLRAEGPNYRGVCVWCDSSTRGSPSTMGVRWKDWWVKPAAIRRVRPLYHLHVTCWAELTRLMADEWKAQCMASGALRLPLLPEVCRVIALFVVRLTADGLGEAAVGRCPVW